MSSAAQDQWVEISVAVRNGLMKVAERSASLTPNELNELTEAIDTAMWNETKAASFDQAVEERRVTLERQAAFGG
jgi:hypothetical protein